MFTGIIDSVGKIAKIEWKSSKVKGDALTLSVQTRYKSLAMGESISVEGVCLTVIGRQPKKSGILFKSDVSEETLNKTTLGKIDVEREVNLERAMKFQDRFGGHFVQGHVDTVGEILSMENQANSKLYTISCPFALNPYVIVKGSIAVDGISLTVVNVDSGTFSVSILPFTENNTSLRSKKVNDPVNIETDMLAKVISKQILAMEKP